VPGYSTPEEAVLAEWQSIPQANVRVVSVEYEDDDHATVVTDTEPSHPMWNQCVRTPVGWEFMGDHN
jgi:hypothetical protein